MPPPEIIHQWSDPWRGQKTQVQNINWNVQDWLKTSNKKEQLRNLRDDIIKLCVNGER